jgi:proteic killer suppression protein
MIETFKNKDTEKLFHTGKSQKVPPDIQERALMRLARIDAAVMIEDLRFPPSHHLEKLKGDRKDAWSLRINQQWRVCFLWQDGHAFDVEIIDYH